jgi:isopenicillin N synthase-like dioxygenase
MRTAAFPLVDIARADADEVRAALLDTGALLLCDSSIDPATCAGALADAEGFFALPAPTKHDLAIERSPHFRGYSEMHNERDWREQIHFGREMSADGSARDFTTLQGPNLWPADPAWRARMLAYLGCVESVAQRLLAAIAASLDLGVRSFADEAGREPHLLMKLIPLPPAAESGRAALRRRGARGLQLGHVDAARRRGRARSAHAGR